MDTPAHACSSPANVDWDEEFTMSVNFSITHTENCQMFEMIHSGLIEMKSRIVSRDDNRRIKNEFFNKPEYCKYRLPQKTAHRKGCVIIPAALEDTKARFRYYKPGFSSNNCPMKIRKVYGGYYFNIIIFFTALKLPACKR